MFCPNHGRDHVAAIDIFEQGDVTRGDIILVKVTDIARSDLRLHFVVREQAVDNLHQFHCLIDVANGILLVIFGDCVPRLCDVFQNSARGERDFPDFAVAQVSHRFHVDFGHDPQRLIGFSRVCFCGWSLLAVLDGFGCVCRQTKARCQTTN